MVEASNNIREIAADNGVEHLIDDEALDHKTIADIDMTTQTLEDIDEQLYTLQREASDEVENAIKSARLSISRAMEVRSRELNQVPTVSDLSEGDRVEAGNAVYEVVEISPDLSETEGDHILFRTVDHRLGDDVIGEERIIHRYQVNKRFRYEPDLFHLIE